MFLAYNNGISVTAESVDIVRDENGNRFSVFIDDEAFLNGLCVSVRKNVPFTEEQKLKREKRQKLDR